MPAKNANIDYCGIRNLLRLLSGQGFTEAELKKIAARIAQETGATIVFVEFHHSVSIAFEIAVWYCMLLIEGGVDHERETAN